MLIQTDVLLGKECEAMKRQDRQGVRTPADIERKYNLGELAASKGLSAKQEQVLNQLSQTLNQYMASTNAKLDSTNAKLDSIEGGKSAYEIAVENGFVGTEQEWLDSIRPKLSETQFNALRPLAEKKILCLGDSVMGNDQVNGVPSYLAEYSGATVYNGGFAASCLSPRTSGSVNVCFDLPRLLDAKISGDWSVQETQAASLSSQTRYAYFPSTVAMLEELDFAQLDIITLAYGSNDWSNGENAEYVLSSLKESIDKIQSNWSNIRVLVITPIWKYIGTGESNGDNYKGYGEGFTLREWAKKIEEAAKEKHISVLNAYENMPLSLNTASTYFDEGSSANLNEKGNQMYAQIICGKLCSLFASQNPDSYEQSGSGANVDLSEYAKRDELPKKLSELENDAGYLTEHQSLEEYAKKSEVPTVPTNVSAFENDKGYLTIETDPTVPAWAKEPNRPIYTADDVNADAKGTASNLVAVHNTGTNAHNDIRLLIQAITARLDAIANSSDTELDQLSEIVAFIKSNKSLIDSITTSKVNVTDIVNNLTTNVDNKPLSAAQGVVLKALIDAITVPTKVSQLENDKGYLTQHQSLDGYAKKTDIPTVPTKVSAFENDKGYLTQHQDLSAYAKKTEIPTVPTKLSQLSNDEAFLTQTEIEALIESIVLNGYLGGYRLRVANDSGKTGYITVKKG